MTNEIDINTSINCHYYNYQGKSENDLLKHSVNCHPRKIARPDKDLLDLIHNYDNGQSVDDNYDKDNELGNYDIELQKRGENEQNEKQLFI